jgi:hypothetical protein
VLAQTPAAAAEATPEGGGIIGGDASWPALVESTRACPKSGSSDSLNALSDVSGPPPQVLNLAIFPMRVHLLRFGGPVKIKVSYEFDESADAIKSGGYNCCFIGTSTSSCGG